MKLNPSEHYDLVSILLEDEYFAKNEERIVDECLGLFFAG